jgi:hypothetical protein
MRTFLFLAGVVSLGQVWAFEIEQFDISKRDRIYYIDMRFSVAAPADEVVAVLTDYSNPNRLNPDVKAQDVLSVHGGVSRVLTEVRSCLFIFCRDITIVQDVTVESTTIRADIVPGISDFRSGSMRWSVTNMSDNMSMVEYTAVMEPDVFIPPLIGRTLIHNMLEKEVLAAAATLEARTSKQPITEQEGLNRE